MADINPLRYRGYYYDQETGLYHLWSRYYDPQTGRFISPDSYASTGQGVLGYNMFAYCQNNPANYFDPSGNAAVVVCHADADTPFIGGLGYLGFSAGSGEAHKSTVNFSPTVYDKRFGLIHNQTTFTHSNAHVGLGTFAGNGCGIIATYNAVQLLGGHESLGKIRDEYLYEHGTILHGLWGVGPWNVGRYLAKHGYANMGFGSFSQLDANVAEGDVIIFTVRNDVNNIFAGFHTMAAQYVGGTYQVYNAYSDTYEVAPVNNLANIYKNSGWRYGYIVGG